MKTLEELKAIRNAARENLSVREESADKTRVVVGMATCGIAAGARPILNEFLSEVARRGLTDVTVSQTGCIGICQLEPVVEVYAPGKEKVTYVKMSPEKVAQVVTEHLVNGRAVREFTIGAYQK
jgi:NADP-reducing hydrogenase subunit HndB